MYPTHKIYESNPLAHATVPQLLLVVALIPIYFPYLLIKRLIADRSKESIMDRPKLSEATRARIASGKATPVRIDKNRLLPLDLKDDLIK